MQNCLRVPFLLAACLLSSTYAEAQWSNASLSAPRQDLQSATAGGLTFFAGGRVGGLVSDVVDIYDPVTNSWTAINMPIARTSFAMTTLGDLVFFIGGAQSATTSTDRVDILDATDLTWQLAHLTEARSALSATSVAGKVIIAGGATGTLFAPVPSDVVDIYDSAQGLPTNPAAWSTWTLTAARGALGATSVGQEALIAGGIGLGNAASDLVDIYDAVAGTWSIAHLSEARTLSRSAALSVDGKAYFAGGQVTPGVGSDRVDIYDSATGTWSSVSLIEPRWAIAGATQGNTAYFAGGFTSAGVSSLVESYNSGTQTWAPALAMPTARGECAAATTGGSLLCAGGIANAGVAASVDVYTPVGVNFCVAETNSTGGAATITVSGSQSLAANDLTLTTTGVPNKPFLYFHGPNQQQVPFGDGFLCAGGALIRIVPPGVAVGGVATRTVDLPSAGISSVGDRNFQCWFRDPAAGGAGFNTSDAATVTFVP